MPPPTPVQNRVSDKGFEVNKVLKAHPVVCACWGFPLQLIWLWELVGHRLCENAKKGQRGLSASADGGSQYILLQKLSHFPTVGPSPSLVLEELFLPAPASPIITSLFFGYTPPLVINRD